MSLSNYFIIFYLQFQSYYKIIQRYLLYYLLGFKELKTYPDTKFSTIRFILFKILTRIIEIIKHLRDKIDISVDKVHVTKIEVNGDKSIIIDKNHTELEGVNFEQLNHKLDNTLVDNDMLKRMFINFYLVNSEEERICLKNFLTKYKDMDEKCHHTLENILIFNDIPHLEDSYILIKYRKDGKFVTYKESLKEVYNKHINYFINF